MPFPSQRTIAPERPWRRQAPRGRRRDREWVAGTLVELDAGNEAITVRVERGGFPIPPRGSEVGIDVRDATFHAVDGDGDGRGSLTDLFPGDQLHIDLRHGRGDRASARRVIQRSAGGVPGGLRRLWRDRSD